MTGARADRTVEEHFRGAGFLQRQRRCGRTKHEHTEQLAEIGLVTDEEHSVVRLELSETLEDRAIRSARRERVECLDRGFQLECRAQQLRSLMCAHER